MDPWTTLMHSCVAILVYIIPQPSILIESDVFWRILFLAYENAVISPQILRKYYIVHRYSRPTNRPSLLPYTGTISS